MSFKLVSLAAVCTLAGVLAGCGEKQGSATTDTNTNTNTNTYEPVVDTKQFMDWIIDPMSDVVWGSAGTITTIEGEENLAPTTQEGWDAVRNAAATLAEAGNLLQMPGHSRGDDWNEIASGLTHTGVLLIEAAENKNEQQVFDYGGQLYNVCLSCHQLYMLPATQ